VRTTLLPLISLAACLLAGPAFAVSYSPQVDFREAAVWGGADDQGRYTATQNGVQITLTAKPTSADLYWDSRDGIGVQYSYENDEIEDGERLVVAFGAESQLSAIYVSDLFLEDGYDEIGFYKVKDGTWHSWVMFDSTLPGTGDNGEHMLEFNPAITVTALKFKAPGRIDGQDHECSVMGLDVAPVQPVLTGGGAAAVPEPSSFAMFCLGGLTIAASRRRRQG
jgi:hypothetical protein